MWISGASSFSKGFGLGVEQNLPSCLTGTLDALREHLGHGGFLACTDSRAARWGIGLVVMSLPIGRCDAMDEDVCSKQQRLAGKLSRLRNVQECLMWAITVTLQCEFHSAAW
ncbi:hypothetical protein Dda_9340 [Drechslerella dactyloides]|uniref:Uncharacterized protein n=1 Tax=Drechslerella dactyloides TaxID=74499 RepID=A0AAD6NEI5_DREDA|nr:hypothetical protein Dda_9340 [Drechslerella dactyloides]